MFQDLLSIKTYPLSQTDEQEDIDSLTISFKERTYLLNYLDRMNKLFWIYRNFLTYFKKYVLNVVSFPNNTLKILEIGGGSGGLAVQLIPFLQKRGYNIDYHILDIHTDVLEWAQQRVKTQGFDIQIHNGGDQHLKIFQDKSFDLVISLHVLHHIYPASVLEEAFRDIMRVSRHGFFMMDMTRCYRGLWIIHLVNMILPSYKFLYADGLKSVRRSYTPPEMRAALTAVEGPRPTFNTTVRPFLLPYQIIYGYRKSAP